MTDDASPSSDERIRRELKRSLDIAWRSAPPSRVTTPPTSPRGLPIHRPAIVLAALAVAATVVAAIAGGSRLLGAGIDPGPQPAGAETSTTPLPTASQSTETSRVPTACAPEAPTRLLDGSPAGSARPVDASEQAYAWGRGHQSITQAVDEDTLGLLNRDEATRVRGPEWTAYAINVGDEGLGEVAFAFESGECKYTVWLPAGTTMDQTIDFISTY